MHTVQNEIDGYPTHAYGIDSCVVRFYGLGVRCIDYCVYVVYRLELHIFRRLQYKQYKQLSL